MLRTLFNKIRPAANRNILRTFGHSSEPINVPYPRDNGAGGYYINPEEVAVRFIRLLVNHQGVVTNEDITLNRTWYELGVKDLDKVEILLAAEIEFDLEFADEDCEKFRDINDVVEHVARSFHAH